VPIFLDFQAERKLNAIVTQWKEPAMYKNIGRIYGAGHGDNLLQSRTYTAWLECVRSMNSAHFPVQKSENGTKCDNDGRK
jgi:hypothetical protein